MMPAHASINLLEIEAPQRPSIASSLTPQQQLDSFLIEVMHIKSHYDDMKGFLFAKGVGDKEVQEYFADLCILYKNVAKKVQYSSMEIKDEHYVYTLIRANMCSDFDLIEYIFAGLKYVKGKYSLKNNAKISRGDMAPIYNFYKQICYILKKNIIDLHNMPEIHFKLGMVESKAAEDFYLYLAHAARGIDNADKFEEVLENINNKKNLLMPGEVHQYNMLRFYYNVEKNVREIFGFEFGIQKINFMADIGECPSYYFLDTLQEHHAHDALLVTIICDNMYGAPVKRTRLTDIAYRRINNIKELNKSLRSALSNSELIHRSLAKVFPGYKKVVSALALDGEPLEQPKPRTIKARKTNKKQPQPGRNKKRKSPRKTTIVAQAGAHVEEHAAVEMGLPAELAQSDVPIEVPIEAVESTPVVPSLSESQAVLALQERQPLEQNRIERTMEIQEQEEYVWDYDEWFNHYIAPYTNSGSATATTHSSNYVLECKNSKASLFLDVVLGRVAYQPLNLQHFNAFLKATSGSKVKMTHKGYIQINYTDRSIETKYALKNYSDDRNEHPYKIYSVHQPHGNEEFPKRTLFNFFKRHLEASGYLNVYLH